MRDSPFDEVDDGMAEDSVVSLMDDWLESSSEEDVFSLVGEDDSAFWHPQDSPAIKARNVPKTIFFLAIVEIILGPDIFVVKKCKVYARAMKDCLFSVQKTVSIDEAK